MIISCPPGTIEEIAYGAGYRGISQELTPQYFEVCAGAGRPFDSDEWSRCWQLGLNDYCSPRAYQLGYAGHYYQASLCPTEKVGELDL